MSECLHPEDRIEWRLWPREFNAPPMYGRQCMDCLAQVDRKLLKPRDVPLDVDTRKVQLRRQPPREARPQKGPNGFGGRGNSKKRAYKRFLSSARWRGPGGIREIVLERDDGVCQDCGAPATEVAHIKYPRDIRDTRPEHCQASCSDCNQSERRQRITRAALGG